MFKKCNILYKIHWRTKGTQAFSTAHVICEQKLLPKSAAAHASSRCGLRAAGSCCVLRTEQGDCIIIYIVIWGFFFSVQICLKKKKKKQLIELPCSVVCLILF